MDSLPDREFRLDAGSEAWRAQKGCKWSPVYDNEGDEVDKEPDPYDPIRMKPLRYQASEGRCNPKGIPVLYCAQPRNTAVSEVRPWLGAQVSVARLRFRKSLRLVNCSKNHGKRNSIIYLLQEPSQEICLEAVWTDIDNAFALPVTESDSTAEYAPTQILGELFRENGFDGIMFKSSVAEGHNLALFDPDVAEVVNRQVVEVKKVLYKEEWSGGDRFKDLDAA
jgi:hypothetical protein